MGEGQAAFGRGRKPGAGMTALLAVAVAGTGLVDPAAPVFHPDDEALLRGAAAFETVRMRRGKPVAVGG